MSWQGWAAAAAGLLGAAGARDQQRANQPQPFTNTNNREPWGPTAGPLADAVDEALRIHQRNVASAPPPRISTDGIHGASDNMRSLANAIRERAMSSDFVPQAQSRALELMSGTNPMVQRTFDRASSYQNPLLEMLQGRAMGGGATPFNRQQGGMDDFLAALMGGQQRLGDQMPPQMGGGPPMPPPQMPPYKPMPQAPQMMRPSGGGSQWYPPQSMSGGGLQAPPQIVNGQIPFK